MSVTHAMQPGHAHAALAPKSDFPLLAAQPELVYLDSAATAQKPQMVLDAIAHFYRSTNYFI